MKSVLLLVFSTVLSAVALATGTPDTPQDNCVCKVDNHFIRINAPNFEEECESAGGVYDWKIVYPNPPHSNFKPYYKPVSCTGTREVVSPLCTKFELELKCSSAGQLLW